MSLLLKLYVVLLLPVSVPLALLLGGPEGCADWLRDVRSIVRWGSW